MTSEAVKTGCLHGRYLQLTKYTDRVDSRILDVHTLSQASRCILCTRTQHHNSKLTKYGCRCVASLGSDGETKRASWLRERDHAQSKRQWLQQHSR